jgi:hypothetical protein
MEKVTKTKEFDTKREALYFAAAFAAKTKEDKTNQVSEDMCVVMTATSACVQQSTESQNALLGTLSTFLHFQM